MKDEIKSTVVQNMASNALRTLCLAYRWVGPVVAKGVFNVYLFPLTRDFPSENEIDEKAELQAAAINWEDEKNVVSCLTCIAIVGIQDPVRPEVRMCRGLGRLGLTSNACVCRWQIASECASLLVSLCAW